MALFISYSSQDRTTADALTSALRRGQNQVWFDQELGGGDSWWAKILEQIRDCEVFIVALSSTGCSPSRVWRSCATPRLWAVRSFRSDR